MKWALAIVGIIAGVIAVIIAIGYALPVAHTATRSLDLAAAPGDVWATITDVGAYPSWRSDVDSVEVLAPVDGRRSWREHGSDGAITYVIRQVEPPTRMVSRIADRDLPFGGEWEFELTPNGAGSRIIITERGEVYNPAFRFVSRFVLGHTATIDRYLRSLGARFGERVEPVTRDG